MHNFILLNLILFSFTFGYSSYEERIIQRWEEVQWQYQPTEAHFLTENIQDFFDKGGPCLRSGQTLLIGFYPIGCGMDFLVEASPEKKSEKKGSFIDPSWCVDFAERWGYEIVFSIPLKQWATFNNRMEIEKFLDKHFHLQTKEGEIPLEFPSKIYIAAFKKI